MHDRHPPICGRMTARTWTVKYHRQSLCGLRSTLTRDGHRWTRGKRRGPGELPRVIRQTLQPCRRRKLSICDDTERAGRLGTQLARLEGRWTRHNASQPLFLARSKPRGCWSIIRHTTLVAELYMARDQCTNNAGRTDASARWSCWP